MGKRVALTKTGDALRRALATFYVSVGVDVAASIGVGLYQALATGDPTTGAFWLGVLGLVAKSLVTGVATFFIRLKFPGAKFGERPA